MHPRHLIYAHLCASNGLWNSNIRGARIPTKYQRRTHTKNADQVVSCSFTHQLPVDDLLRLINGSWLLAASHKGSVLYYDSDSLKRLLIPDQMESLIRILIMSQWMAMDFDHESVLLSFNLASYMLRTGVPFSAPRTIPNMMYNQDHERRPRASQSYVSHLNLRQLYFFFTYW